MENYIFPLDLTSVVDVKTPSIFALYPKSTYQKYKNCDNEFSVTL